MIEIELRYKVLDPQRFLNDLPPGVVNVRSEHLTDQWFAPQTVRNMAQEKEWFDVNKGIAWRVRRKWLPDGQIEMELASKQLTSHNNHNSFHETTSPITNYTEALEWLASQNYRNWLTIDKTRTWLKIAKYQNVETVLDVIAGLQEKIGIGACLELEYKGKEERGEALEHLGGIAKLFGLSSKDQYEKSLTVQAMDELANFN